jgi:hypothetical protein
MHNHVFQTLSIIWKYGKLGAVFIENDLCNKSILKIKNGITLDYAIVQLPLPSQKKLFSPGKLNDSVGGECRI